MAGKQGGGQLAALKFANDPISDGREAL